MTDLKIQKVLLDESKRIICISDIHGDYQNFKLLLRKIKYVPTSDYLFILGDLCEKGDESLLLIKYILSLCKKGKIFITEGNWDPSTENLDDELLLDYIRMKPNSIFTQMLKESE